MDDGFHRKNNVTFSMANARRDTGFDSDVTTVDETLPDNAQSVKGTRNVANSVGKILQRSSRLFFWRTQSDEPDMAGPVNASPKNSDTEVKGIRNIYTSLFTNIHGSRNKKNSNNNNRKKERKKNLTIGPRGPFVFVSEAARKPGGASFGTHRLTGCATA